MRRSITIGPKEFSTEQLLEWGRQFDPFVLLNSNTDSQHQTDPYARYDLLIAAGALEFVPSDRELFSAIRNFHVEKNDWLFGCISYDVKNQVEQLTSENIDGTGFPLYRFFRPRLIVLVSNYRAEIQYDDESDDEESVRKELDIISRARFSERESNIPEIRARVSKDNYVSNFEKIKQHIQSGDIYEMNYCMEFFSENAVIDPPTVYSALNNISPMPFSAYMRSGGHYLMCASPERYLARRKNKIISQPIKGTAKRGANRDEDDLIRQRLQDDKKEQSENVMIVDMVRNDLSRTAARGSVRVEELFGIKKFKNIFQMVSTVVSEIREGIHFTDVIARSFPMGSMTGTPKISAMRLIEEYEISRRGLFSGSIGYIEPGGDFDFNVIIRSILYNERSGYLSYMAGSAITIAADAEREYEECLLKASTMTQVLSQRHERAGTA